VLLSKVSRKWKKDVAIWMLQLTEQLCAVSGRIARYVIYFDSFVDGLKKESYRTGQ